MPFAIGLRRGHRACNLLGGRRYQHVHALQSFSKRGLIEHRVSISFWRITHPIRLKCRRLAAQNPMLIPIFRGTDEKLLLVLHIWMAGRAKLVILIVEDLDYEMDNVA